MPLAIAFTEELFPEDQVSRFSPTFTSTKRCLFGLVLFCWSLKTQYWILNTWKLSAFASLANWSWALLEWHTFDDPTSLPWLCQRSPSVRQWCQWKLLSMIWTISIIGIMPMKVTVKGMNNFDNWNNLAQKSMKITYNLKLGFGKVKYCMIVLLPRGLFIAVRQRWVEGRKYFDWISLTLSNIHSKSSFAHLREIERTVYQSLKFILFLGTVWTWIFPPLVGMCIFHLLRIRRHMSLLTMCLFLKNMPNVKRISRGLTPSRGLIPDSFSKKVLTEEIQNSTKAQVASWNMNTLNLWIWDLIIDWWLWINLHETQSINKDYRTNSMNSWIFI